MTRSRPDFSAQFGPRALYDDAQAFPSALGEPFAFSDLTRHMLQFGASFMVATAIIAATSFAAGAAVGYTMGAAHKRDNHEV